MGSMFESGHVHDNEAECGDSVRANICSFSTIQAYNNVIVRNLSVLIFPFDLAVLSYILNVIVFVFKLELVDPWTIIAYAANEGTYLLIFYSICI